MIPLWLQKLEIWFSIAASFATIIGAGAVVTTVVCFFKNLINKRHVKFILKEIMEESNEDTKFFLRVENHTDKKFYITQIELDNKNHLYTAKEIRQPFPKVYSLTDLEPVKISSFECINIAPVFELKKSQIHKSAKLIIQTTAGRNINLGVFRILKPKQSENAKPDCSDPHDYE